ncbi:hypothetical protein RJZ56_004744 [Blastomyces dermatitidis]|uniref:DUF4604 domain-containing protein n=3 Tax=Blastomyces TaxID=229219 RepID=A0A179V0U8_BLAGS|nr:uncharacterized protein BDBG_08301 [Blastomyces gilchristii SLH14081]XP_045276779.1 uncharacterized protein BDCG_05072 [Blastomyces dermatitidis ER-3]EGE80995.1 hypothetical protein BDDG_03936 [Blastomyces dermatitidis ATCC 18188]EQL37775.1 hypothetical protein BDFG_00825 [Blastomyces dermatitidis ATCC 26199]EEQ89952.1 hypothetical protein BDCG_05072 [Blastomyces dermatitidis ER-3]OAT13027.1 hypothetical protein BDBG_08301 [Blastomyces gilchristii SLH14081]
MSFNAKNLTYEKNEPAFLRKLRSQYGDGSGFRNDRPSPRPTKKKDADDDDAPTYVDEASNEIISKEEYDVLVRGDSDNKIGERSGNNRNENEKTRSTNDTGDGVDQGERQGPKAKRNQHFAEIGGAKKRKQAKVIGEDATEDATRKPPASRKPKLKKKIKLSFEHTD